MGDVFMIEDNEPLMYIYTSGTKVSKSGEQVVYDSRRPKTVLPKELNDTSDAINYSLQERKLKNILEMYDKNRPVYCGIDYKDGHVEGIPYKKEDNMLKIIVTTENVVSIDLADLKNISIIRF